MAQQQQQNAIYAQWWTIVMQMPPDARKDMWDQLVAKIMGLPIVGVVEALEDAPEAAKKDAWALWAKSHDLSGKTLRQIESLKDTEPAIAVDSMMRAWIGQADLSACDLSDVSKMSAKFPTLEDIDELWTRWAKQTDLRRFEIETFCKAVSRVPPSVCEKLIAAWLAQKGENAVSDVDQDRLSKIKKMLPANAKRMLMNARGHTATITTPAKFHMGQPVRVVNPGYWSRIDGVAINNGVWKYHVRDCDRFYDERELSAK